MPFVIEVHEAICSRLLINSKLFSSRYSLNINATNWTSLQLNLPKMLQAGPQALLTLVMAYSVTEHLVWNGQPHRLTRLALQQWQSVRTVFQNLKLMEKQKGNEFLELFIFKGLFVRDELHLATTEIAVIVQLQELHESSSHKLICFNIWSVVD